MSGKVKKRLSLSSILNVFDMTWKTSRLQLEHTEWEAGDLSVVVYSFFMKKFMFSVKVWRCKLLRLRSPKYLMSCFCRPPEQPIYRLSYHVWMYVSKWRAGHAAKQSLRVLGPGFKKHGCELSSFLLRESIQSTVFLLSSLSALCGPCLSFTRTLTEACFSLSLHLVYVFTTAHSHPRLNDAPPLSAHRSQIREWDRPALPFLPSFRQAEETEGAINWNSELFALFWSVLDIREKGCYPSAKTVLLLPERDGKKGASEMRPVLQWAPAVPHRLAPLARVKRQTRWRLCSDTTRDVGLVPYVPPSALRTAMWRSVNARRIISCLSVIYRSERLCTCCIVCVCFLAQLISYSYNHQNREWKHKQPE